MTKRMVIIGGGIMGASFAWHARQRNVADLQLVTAALPGAPQQATSGTWGWINGYADDDPDYAAFRLASLNYWPDLIDSVTGLAASATGAFIWDLKGEALPRSIKQHQSWGHDVTLAPGSTARQALPHLKTCPEETGFGRHDLAIEGRHAARALIEASEATLSQTTVKTLLTDGDRITGVDTEDGILEADEVILTAGLGTPPLLADIDVPFAMKSSLGLLAYTQPLPPLLAHPVTGMDFHARQDADGRLVIGGAFGDNAEDDPDHAASAEKLVRDMAERLDYTGPITLERFTVGRRPLPLDGRPKIGRVKRRDGVVLHGLYIAVMHSGMTNAPIAGKLGIKEVMTGVRDPLLAGFAPQPQQEGTA